MGEYSAALERLFMRTSNPKLGLERMTRLLDLISFDRAPMQIIQVVGTNGKGSTVAFIEAMLKKNGISCGLFTSPHLCCARERIRINGQMVSEEDFVWATNHVVQKEPDCDAASFFEVILAMAMALFQKNKVEVAILEAGLGGRLDATTATRPDILGISTIDFDHQNILGTTIGEIATQKIGAARSFQKVLTVAQSLEATVALEKASAQIGCHLQVAPHCDASINLFGSHQKINAGLAWALCYELGRTLNADACLAGLKEANWPGRFEIVDQALPTVLDGAHNPSGIRALTASLMSHPQFNNRPLVMVYGSLDGPNVESKITLLRESGLFFRRIFLHQSNNPRAAECAFLKTLFIRHGFLQEMLEPYSTWEEVQKQARPDAAIVVCGSLYSVGEIRGRLLSIPVDGRLPNF